MRVWVDCTAAAHPLVLRPIVERLRERGHEVEITAREYGQTVGILDRLGLDHTIVGEHGDSTIAKAGALASRSSSLRRWARKRGFELAAGHGSVDLAVVATLLGIPSAQMQDYEHAGLQRQLAFRAARRVLAPDAIPVDAMRRAGATAGKLVRYPGLKEDYYLADFEPDRAVLGELSLDESRVLVVLRPPPESSAYHARNPLYDGVLDRVAAHGQATAVVIPRTEVQRQAAQARANGGEPVVVPERAIDAQSLIAYADLVVSAGGTMNREAVALGTPVYTIFSGRIGAVDKDLIDRGLLLPLSGADDLALRKREGPAGVQNPRDAGLLVDGILEAIQPPPAGGRIRFRAPRRSSDA